MKSIVISSGHGKYIRGASAILDEVDEARRVVEGVAEYLQLQNVNVTTFHDDVSKSQQENLERIVGFHNDQSRDLDVSVHFNCYQDTTAPMGTEVFYLTQHDLAGVVVNAIADAGGFINRGPKKKTDFYFLNNTGEPALLLEICFVDSAADAELYNEHFGEICEAIALSLSGAEVPDAGTTVGEFKASGRASWFGGPFDSGVAPDEGLAFIHEVDDAPQLFLPKQPKGTTGLARRLNPFIHYLACRWDYDLTPHEMLKTHLAVVRAAETGVALVAFPADWGPHADTGRVADLSPALLYDLGLQTDGEVEIIFPAPNVSRRGPWL